MNAAPINTTGAHRRSLVLAGAVLFVLLLVIYWLAGALFPFAIAGVLSYALFPLVKDLEGLMPWRARFPNASRGISIGLVLLVVLASIGGITALVLPLIAREAADFWFGFPEFFREARVTIERLNLEYVDRIPVEVRQNIENHLATAGDILLGAVQDGVGSVFGFVSSALSLVVGLSVAPIFLFYLLKDHDRIAAGWYTPFPAAIRTHLNNIASIVNQTIAAYIRGQLVLGLVVGILVAVGLSIIGVPFSVLLGLVAGITELMPIIGPWMGGAAGVVVTLAFAPEKLVWVLLLYLSIQLVENSLLVPRIQGDALKLHPILIMVIIVIGSQSFGIWGIILGPLLVAGARDIIRYFVSEWNRPVGPVPAAIAVETVRDSQNSVNVDTEGPLIPTVGEDQ
jgi:predicted PurR-regulated permease PerM